MAGATGKDFKLSWNGTDITGVLLDPITFAKDGTVEDTTPYGVDDQQQTYSGLRKLPDLTFGGLYDDTVATGEDAVFNQVGVSAPLVITWKSGKTTTLAGVIKSYARMAGVGKATRFKSTIACVGPVTEA